ncbi:hypothetical protein HOB10_01510 [Candidatus Parcubacteria bacterium]|jgi:hypothetical protein|nr:hypothetical protein [Candidatus Parcubacteria bacterium]
MLISKKTFYLWTLAAILSVFVISGCSKDSEDKKDDNNSFTNSVVEEDKSEAIMALFTEKYNRDSEEVVITIHKETDNYVRGSVKFNEEPEEMYLFLAAKEDQDWQLVFEGASAVPCSAIEEYNFPEDMVSDCYIPPVATEVDHKEIDIDSIDWKTYSNDVHAYSVEYPGICNAFAADNNVQFTGELNNDDHWPSISVIHYNSQYYRPAADTDVNEWVKQFPGFTKGGDISIAGLPTVHFVQERTANVFAGDYYYFIKGDQLFSIRILHTDDRVDWNLYNRFLNSFTFVEEVVEEVEEMPTEVEGTDVDSQVACVTDEDCVPVPGCHPHQCINANFVDQYEQPEMCTLQFECSAAYNAEDCLCQSNVCVNINLTEGCTE